MRKKWLIIFLCFFLSACGRPIELKKHTFTIELGKDVYANPALYVKQESGQNLSRMEIDVTSIGVVKKNNRFVSSGYDYLLVGEYDFAVKKDNKSIPFKIKIKDTQPPTIEEKVTEVTALQNEDIDWDSYIHASDLSGVKYSTSKDATTYIGEHMIDVTISDRFGNSIVEAVNIKVE